jgi:thymidylate kinase
MIICFNGIDGSGKSSQAQLLVARLQAEGYPAVHVWTGGKRSLRRPFIWLGKRLLRSRARKRTSSDAAGRSGSQSDYQAYLSSTEQVFKRRGLRALWEQISLIEHAVEIWAQVMPHLLRGRIVVCDRYLHDTILRVAVLSGTPPARMPDLLRKLRYYYVPRITVGLLIDVPADVAMSRKDDVPDIAFLERRIPLFRALAATLNMRVIDGTRDPDEVAEDVWREVQPLLPRHRASPLPEQGH